MLQNRASRPHPPANSEAILKDKCPSCEADDISNLCFIAGKTNRQISDKPPAQYFPDSVRKSGIER